MVTHVAKVDAAVTALKEIRSQRVAREVESVRTELNEASAEKKVESPERIENPTPSRDYGKYNDYTVNSEHELVITVRERFTGKEIKQIPSKEVLAAKHAHRRAVERIFDEKV